MYDDYDIIPDDDLDIIDAEFDAEPTTELACINESEPETNLPELGYYRCIKAEGPAPKYPQVGDLIYLYETPADNSWRFYFKGNTFYVTSDEDQEVFAEHYVFEPEGEQLQQHKLNQAMTEMANLNAEAAMLGQTLSEFRPHIGIGGQFSVAADDETAITPSVGTPVEAKRQLAHLRNNMQKVQGAIEAKAKEIRAFLDERAAIMQAQVADLSGIIRVAEEAIWTINLYLGKDEEVVVLAKGEPAPTEEPITLRQRVLYMDEECQINPSEDGIDATEIVKFDRWLLADPANLNMIIPEPKCLVALKVRRTRKSYVDPVRQKEMDEANKKTYFLMRNGENIYRLWIDYDCGGTLFPRTDEFTSCFKGRRYNTETHEYEEIELTPGSREFMEAEQHANNSPRHYMRLGLILQGIVDRSTIWHPLSRPVDFTRWQSYADGTIRVINDAENALPDGRERFDAWLKRINSELAPGMRVIGDWSRLNDFREQNTWNNSRLSPKGAELPSDGVLYTIEGRRESGFYFYYKRTETNYGAGYWKSEDHSFQRRASCMVDPRDKFILNFDVATVDELNFYLRSRADREHYMWMVPLMQEALSLKRAEAEAEAPFRSLLIGQIVKAYEVSFEDAETEVDDLIKWWKFKNKTHRSLLSDDASALEMIVKEYAIRRREITRRQKLRASGFYTSLTTRVHSHNNTEPLLVAHKSGSDYTVLIPANERDIFVHEQIWRAKRDNFELVETRSWRTVDKRFRRWDVIYTSARWENWRIGVNRWEHLTDPEADDLAEQAHVNLLEQRQYRSTNPKDNPEVLPLAVTVTHERKVMAYAIAVMGCVPETDLITAPESQPTVYEYEAEWKRDREKNVQLYYMSAQALHYPGITDIRQSGHKLAMKTVSWWPNNVDKLKEFDQTYALYEAEEKVLNDKALDAEKQLEAAYRTKCEAREFHKFLTEFGDPDLWEGHKKTLKAGTLPGERWYDPKLRFVLQRVVERGHEIEGLTVAQIFELFKAEGPAAHDPEKDEQGWGGRIKFNPYTLELDADLMDLEVEDGSNDPS